MDYPWFRSVIFNLLSDKLCIQIFSKNLATLLAHQEFLSLLCRCFIAGVLLDWYGKLARILQQSIANSYAILVDKFISCVLLKEIISCQLLLLRGILYNVHLI